MMLDEQTCVVFIFRSIKTFVRIMYVVFGKTNDQYFHASIHERFLGLYKYNI